MSSIDRSDNNLSPESIMNSPEKAELVQAIEEAKTQHGVDDVTGKIVCGRNNLSHWDLYNEKVRRRLERAHQERVARLGFAEIFGCRISVDHGRTWKLRAICKNCIAAAEPPTRIKNEGPAAARNCDICGAYNEEQRREAE